MKKASVGLIAALAAFGLAGNAQAQMYGGLPLSVEVRGGLGIPTGDFGEESDGAEIENGVGFGANLKYQFTPLLAAYAGYSRFEFGTDLGDDPELSEVEVDVIDSGFNGGVQANFSPMMALGGMSPWLRGGAVYREVEFEAGDDDVGVSVESDPALGFEVGGGLDYPLGQVISVTPGVRYVRYTPEFDDAIDAGEDEGDVSYFVADIGLQFRF